MAENIKLFTSEECEECAPLKDALATGKVQVLGLGDDIPIEVREIINGDDLDEEYVDLGYGPIPSAYYKTKQCEIFRNDEGVYTIDCRTILQKKEDVDAEKG